MTIDRRKFFELMLAPAIAAAIPVGEWLEEPLPVQAVPGFDPTKQYGNYLYFTDPGDRDEVLDMVVKDMRQLIPRGCACEMLVRMPGDGDASDPLLHAGCIAWKYPAAPGSRLVIVS